MKDLDEKTLGDLYKNYTNKQICFMLKITPPTLSKYLDKLGIKRKRILAGKKKYNIVAKPLNTN